MGLADYFHRSAVSIGQVLAGFDEQLIRERLESVTIGVSIGPDASESEEGQALADLAVRLIARLYPRLQIEGAAGLADWLRTLAKDINPNIELVDGRADVSITIGAQAQAIAPTQIHAGSDGWDAHISTTTPQTVAASANPIGAGIAACLACANVFRFVFLGGEALLDGEVTLSGLDLQSRPSRGQPTFNRLTLDGGVALVGLGAVGNAAIWTLSRAQMAGSLHLIDHEPIERSNLQRYVLATRADEGRDKTEIARAALNGELRGTPYTCRWQEFVAKNGHVNNRVLVALDSAGDRRAVQASLPRWIANAWTQPGDLGVSVHPWDENGACLACLYLPNGPLPSEDELVARALGFSAPGVIGKIRELLRRDGSPPRQMLEETAANLRVPLDDLLPYTQRSIRDLYVEGICGGAVLPLDRLGASSHDVHVPLAHQSALAGVLLASRLLAALLDQDAETTAVTRLDVLRPVSEYLTQSAGKDPRGVCICQDTIYRTAYARKYRQDTIF